MTTGRNDPCPCGSGKKYKQCCLAAAHSASDSAADIAWRRIRRANEGLVSKMLRFAKEAYGSTAIDEAWDEFMLWNDDAEWVDNPQCSAFLPWMLHLWTPDPEETSVVDESLIEVPPTRAFLERQGKRLDPVTRRYLEACLVAPFGFHEILACNPGQGFRCRELITGEECEVLESSGSKAVQPGDVLYASLVHCDGIVMMEGSGPCIITPINKLPILKFRDKISAERDLPARELLQAWDAELRTLYLDISEPLLHPVLPQLRNTDGDELSLQRVIFDIDSAQQAFDTLKHLALGATDEELLENAERTEDGGVSRVEFQWLKSGNKLHQSWDNTSMGTIEIRRSRLTVRVNSAQRAAAIKQIIVERLGEHARYRATEIQSVEQALADSKAAKSSAKDFSAAEALANDPAVQAHMSNFMARHYDDWLTQSIPALDGETPLQAVQHATGREMVVALVAQIERDGKRMTPPLDTSIPRRLRDRLSLDR